MCTFVKAEILIRVEDLAFILCWADEAGWVVGCVVPTPFSLSFFPFVCDIEQACLTQIGTGHIVEIELPRLGLRFKAPCGGFDQIQEICRRKPNVFSLHYTSLYY